MRHKQLLFKPLCAALLIALSGTTTAGGFGVTVQSGSGGGNAATGHAMAEDASAMYYNPALLFSMEGRQLNSGFSVVSSDSTVTNTGSTLPLAAAGTPVIGENVGELGGASIAPSFFYRGTPIFKNMVYGIGVNAPFGTSTEYNSDSFTRYEATTSHLKAININPAVAWQMNDKLDMGAGLNVQIGEAELGRSVDSFLICQRFIAAGAAPAGTCDALGLGSASNVATDGKVAIKADGIAYGFNFGAAYRPDDNTTFSLGLRSAVKYELEGDADFTHHASLAALGDASLAAAGLGDQKATTNLEMPASASFAVARKMNDKLTLHGDATWTGWSSVPEIRIKFPDTVADDSVTNTQWEDTVRVGAGMTYQMNDNTRLRAGIAMDPTPTPDAKHRTPRAPSSDNLWLSGGISHQFNKKLSIDAGLSLVKPADTAINYTAPGASDYTTRADVEADVIVGSVSVNYRF